MIQRLRPAIAPAYLVLCLLLGGSAQGVWGNALLQLMAVVIIAWALIGRHEDPLGRPTWQLLAIISLALLLVLVQLVPLPVSIWSALSGRDLVVAGQSVLGVPPAAMALSLAPHETIATLLAVLPPLGMLAAIIGLRGYSPAWLAAALIAGTFAAVLLGILQVTSANPSASPWYLYRQSNFGVATGFFANVNHMASLLLATIPFIAALGVSARQHTKDIRLRSAGLALVTGGLILVVIGLFLNRSLAGYGLAVPVLLASALLLIGPNKRLGRTAAGLVGIVTLTSLALLWSSPISRQVESSGASTSISSRQAILDHGFAMFDRFGPLGSGLGTFEKAYPLTEDPTAVDRVYVNHAHNDYLELVVETGLPGAALILLFLIWWAASVIRMLKSPAADQFAIAGAIASAAMLLHSLVDYPLRTAAMSAVFAMCLALILQSRRTAHSEGDLRPTRHLVVG